MFGSIQRLEELTVSGRFHKHKPLSNLCELIHHGSITPEKGRSLSELVAYSCSELCEVPWCMGEVANVCSGEVVMVTFKQ